MMGGINVNRWLAGGVAAGILIWVMEGITSMLLYMDDMEAALTAHSLSMELSAGVMVLTVVVSLIAGLTLIFFYAAARPRFGPGPKTAVIVAVGFWFGGWLLSLIGYQMIGLYPTGLLIQWGIVGLVELILAALLGGVIYREA
jgi:hypothetical protein